MKKQVLILFLLPMILIINCSQNKTSENWKYLKQIPPGQTAQLFVPQIIKHHAHSSPSFTPDGKEIYWSAVSVKNETRKIYYVKYENNKWSEPKVASFSGNYHDDQPFISYDGQKLYFASKRPKAIDGNQEIDIWISHKTAQGWGEPSPINNLIGFWTPSVTKNGVLYFLDFNQDIKEIVVYLDLN